MQMKAAVPRQLHAASRRQISEMGFRFICGLKLPNWFAMIHAYFASNMFAMVYPLVI